MRKASSNRKAGTLLAGLLGLGIGGGALAKGQAARTTTPVTASGSLAGDDHPAERRDRDRDRNREREGELENEREVENEADEVGNGAGDDNGVDTIDHHRRGPSDGMQQEDNSGPSDDSGPSANSGPSDHSGPSEDSGPGSGN